MMSARQTGTQALAFDNVSCIFPARGRARETYTAVCETSLTIADGEFVIVHGRFSGFGSPVNWIAADILRIQDGILVEHWDVIQDEVTEEQSKSKAPMFGTTFPKPSTQTTTAK